jgi:hypothetical protein
MSQVPVDPRVKSDMAKKLSAFDRVAKKAAMLVARSARSDGALLEALHTKTPANLLTENGMSGYTHPATPTAAMQVGNYAVFAIPNEAGKSRYDVVNMTTQQKLVGGLHLAEGANSIVKLMNKGHSFYSPQVKTLLDLENEYVKHYNDALTFRRKSKASGTQDMVLETRFQESKTKASEVKQKLVEYVKKI